jgi:hypothetical protein
MPKFAANLSMLYPELPFLDRFEAAARDGFKAVEYLFPYAYVPAERPTNEYAWHGGPPIKTQSVAPPSARRIRTSISASGALPSSAQTASCLAFSTSLE